MKDQKLIYVAGKYRAPTEWEVLLNIRAAEDVALQLWQAGAAVICPHKNTALFGGAAEDEIWLKGDITMMLRCDAICTVSGWQESRGAVEEIDIAIENKIPVFHSVSETRNWIQGSCSNADYAHEV